MCVSRVAAISRSARLYEAFASLKPNADGEVKLSTIREMIMRVSATPIDDGALRAWMAEADSDGSNSLSFFEYVRVDTRLSAEGPDRTTTGTGTGTGSSASGV